MRLSGMAPGDSTRLYDGKGEPLMSMPDRPRLMKK